MSGEATGGPGILSRRTTRRAVVGATAAAGSVAAAYALLGDRLDFFGGGASTQDVLNDAAAIKREPVRVSHLLRRAGFGTTREEHEHYQSLGLKGSIDEVVSYQEVDDSAAVSLAAQVPIDGRNRQNLSVWWLVRMANTRRPLQEKMTLFWHGHLTSQLSVVHDPKVMLAQNEFLRSHALDGFDAILRGVTGDTAMMVYLDMDGSHRRAPNENYARELMELFSLGIGNYTEQDIRDAARAFTGWMVPRVRVVEQNDYYLTEPVFRPERFDDGVKTVLGHTGSFRPDDIVDIIVQQPASASFIVRKLFSYFVFPDPSDSDIAPFVTVYNDSGRKVGAVVEALLRSDVFYSPKAYRAIIRSPVEYVVAAVKAVGAQEQIAQVLGLARRGTQNMGQVPFEPPNVAGWPGGPTWLNSATMFARLNFVNQVTNLPNARGERQPADLGTPQHAMDYYLPMVLDDNVPDGARQVFAEYAGGPEASLTPEQLRGLVYLFLASPQFHLS